MGFTGSLVPRGHTTAFQTALGGASGPASAPAAAQPVSAATAGTGQMDTHPWGSLARQRLWGGQALSVSTNSSTPWGRTVTGFCLQNLRAPAQGFLWLDTRCGWHGRPAGGLALDRQRPGTLGTRRSAQMWRVPHQLTVGPHSSPLLCHGQVRSTGNRDVPAPRVGSMSPHHAAPIPPSCSTSSAQALPSPAGTAREKGSGHRFRAASSPTSLQPKAREGTRAPQRCFPLSSWRSRRELLGCADEAPLL